MSLKALSPFRLFRKIFRIPQKDAGAKEIPKDVLEDLDLAERRWSEDGENADPYRILYEIARTRGREQNLEIQRVYQQSDGRKELQIPTPEYVGENKQKPVQVGRPTRERNGGIFSRFRNRRR